MEINIVVYEVFWACSSSGAQQRNSITFMMEYLKIETGFIGINTLRLFLLLTTSLESQSPLQSKEPKESNSYNFSLGNV